MDFLTGWTLPTDPNEAMLALNMTGKSYTVVDNILYYEGTKISGRCCVAVKT